MILIKFREEWRPKISDWNPAFEPTDYLWAVEDGLFRDHDNDVIDLIAINSPGGESLHRMSKSEITLADIVNLYDSDLSIKDAAFHYNRKGEWTYE